MNRVRTRLGAALATVALGASALAITGGTAHAVTEFPNPQLTFNHTITSHPFSGAPANASDIEGLGDVGPDNSIWVADDNADAVWEIDATTGAYKARLRDGISGGTHLHNATPARRRSTAASSATPAPTSASAGPTTSSRRSTTPRATCSTSPPVGAARRTSRSATRCTRRCGSSPARPGTSCRRSGRHCPRARTRPPRAGGGARGVGLCAAG